MGRQGSDDLVGDVVLDLEYVGQRSIVSFGPDMRAVVGTDELRDHPDRVSGAPYGAFQHGIHIQRLRHVRDRRVLVLEVETGSPRGDPQAVHLGQEVQQFLRQAVTEVFVFLVLAHVDERQDGDGVQLGSRALRSRTRCLRGLVVRGTLRLVPTKQPVPQQDDDRDRHQPDDQVIQLVSGLPGDGLLRPDLAGASDPLRGQLEGPGQQERKWKTNNTEPQNQLQSELGQAQRRGDDVGDLHHHPAQHQIGDAHAEDVAAFEFLEKRHFCCVCPPLDTPDHR